MKVGNLIAWTFEGDTTEGVVLEVTDKKVKFKTLKAVFEVPLKDGEFKVIENNSLVEQIQSNIKQEKTMATATKKNGSKKNAPKAKKVQVERKARTGTKAEKARELFQKMKGSERKDVIAAFMKQCDLSKPAASTYYQNIKREMSK